MVEASQILRKKLERYMGVNPKIVVKPPKWMVKIMKKPIKIGDLGGPPLFLETSIYILQKQKTRVHDKVGNFTLFLQQSWFNG